MAECNICQKEDVINDLKERIEKIEVNDREDYANIKELNTTIKMFAESNQQQAQVISDISNTLVKVNSNLDMLSAEMKVTKDDVNELTKKVNNMQVEEVKKTSFDFLDIVKKWLIPFLMGYGGYYVITHADKIIK